MTTRSPLRPSQLDHIRIDADDPKPVVAFYRDALAFTPTELADGSYVLAGRGRRLVIGPGTRGEQSYSAFRLENVRQLAAVETHLKLAGLPLLPSPSPLPYTIIEWSSTEPSPSRIPFSRSSSVANCATCHWSIFRIFSSMALFPPWCESVWCPSRTSRNG